MQLLASLPMVFALGGAACLAACVPDLAVLILVACSAAAVVDAEATTFKVLLPCIELLALGDDLSRLVLGLSSGPSSRALRPCSGGGCRSWSLLRMVGRG